MKQIFWKIFEDETDIVHIEVYTFYDYKFVELSNFSTNKGSFVSYLKQIKDVAKQYAYDTLNTSFTMCNHYTTARIDFYKDDYELISDSAEIDNSGFTSMVYYDKKNKQFIALANIFTLKDTYYKFKKPFEQIKKDHREEILNSTLCTYDQNEEVALRDVFLHGGYIEKIK